MTELFLSPGAKSIVRCGQCGTVADGPELTDACVACGGLFEAIHARPPEGGQWREAMRRGGPGLRAETGGRDSGGLRPEVASGVWRFRELVMPGATRIVSYPEGRTPLLSRDSLSAYTGVARLELKHEGFNPTGSFKDRGMTAAITDAAARGARAIACASTGNTSSSLAAYAAIAGIPALVFVPKGKVTSGKIAQTMAHGARTLEVNGDFDTALQLARAASRELGVYLANSVNPWRIEGQKTITWELLRQLDWKVPDWIALPAGALGNTAAMGKALREAKELGLIDRVPRVLAVQAAGAAPFAAGFAAGFTTRVTVQAETVATAIRIGDPASWDRAVRTIVETDGHVVAVDDSAILDAKAVIDASGVGCEPASAASVAGVKRMREQGVIAKDAHVVCVLTGHLLKDPEAVAAYHGGANARANPVIRIEASLSEVERVLRG